MAAEFTASVVAQLTGLGKQLDFIEKGTDETTPTAGTYNYRVIAAADTAEVLDLGDVTTVTAIILYAIDFDVIIDTTYVSAFVSELTAKAGGIPVVITYPSGTVYVKGEATKTPKYEYLLVGTT